MLLLSVIGSSVKMIKIVNIYEGSSESSVIGVITLLIDVIGCCIIPSLTGLHFSFIMMTK